MSEVIGKELAVALKALSKMASTDKDRPHLNAVRMDGGVWAATNGHAVLIIEVEAEVDAHIPLHAVKDVIALTKSDALPWQIDAEERRFVSVGRDISFSWTQPGEEFPDWRKILPKDGRTPENPSFNAGLMKQCMDALTTLGMGSITMHCGEPLEPMLMVGHGPFGDFVKSARVVLMPVRV